MASPTPVPPTAPVAVSSPATGAVGPTQMAPRMVAIGPTLAPQLPPIRPVRANEPQATTAPGPAPLRFAEAPQFSFPAPPASVANSARS